MYIISYTLLLLLRLTTFVKCNDIPIRLEYNETVYIPVNTSDVAQDLIRRLHVDSAGIPIKCRPDYCKLEDTDDKHKGELWWHATPVGHRRYQRCAYAFNDDTRLACFDCMPGPDRAVWINLNLTMCPDTPLTEALREIANPHHSDEVNKNVTAMARYLDNILRSYSQIGMLPWEWTQVYELLLATPVSAYTDLPTMFHLWDVLVHNDYVMLDDDFNATFYIDEDDPNVYEEITRRAAELGQITTLPVSLCNDFLTIEVRLAPTDNITNVIPQDGPSSTQTTSHLHVPVMFTHAPRFNSHVNVTLPTVCKVCHVSVVGFRSQKILNSTLIFQDNPAVPTLNFLPFGSITGYSQRSYMQHGITLHVDVNHSNGSILSNGDMTLQVSLPKVELPENLNRSLIICGYSDFRLPQEPESAKDTVYKRRKVHFSPYRCGLRSNSPLVVTCICEVPATRSAMITLFFATKAEVKVQNDANVGVFLRFPYNYELALTGNILKAVSTLCLFLTLLSYSVFKNARRGVLTWILLNLVVAMLCVHVVFYVSRTMTNNYMGCRVANALRLYFILVSLMWNGVEAVNMYLLLIKVFNSEIEHFVLKAAAVAWGLPLLPIVISLIVNLHSFDGEWIDCVFTCSLPQMMMYFAMLLPMGIIMVFNGVVFILVLKVISAKQMASKDMKRSKLVQLSGAVTMLALLGAPWIFSVFGVIDGRMNKDLALVELAFHVIFIILVNIQGVFIFWFHCLRIKEISYSWRHLLARVGIIFRLSRPAYSVSTSSGKTNTTSTM